MSLCVLALWQNTCRTCSSICAMPAQLPCGARLRKIAPTTGFPAQDCAAFACGESRLHTCCCLGSRITSCLNQTTSGAGSLFCWLAQPLVHPYLEPPSGQNFSLFPFSRNFRRKFKKRRQLRKTPAAKKTAVKPSQAHHKLNPCSDNLQ